MGPSARWILIHNDTHVNAMDDPVGCASGLVQTFIRNPASAQADERVVRGQDAGGPGGWHVPGEAQRGHARDRAAR